MGRVPRTGSAAVSEPSDYDEDPSLIAREWQCDRCECTYQVEGKRTPATYDSPAWFVPLDPFCPSCSALGCEPPPCPQCLTPTLRGHRLCESTEANFECSECDARFGVSVLRALLFGRAVERIVRQAPVRRMHDIAASVLRAARELKVIS